MRALAVLLVLAACDPELGGAPSIVITTGHVVTAACEDSQYPAGGGVVPYRAGGEFEVAISLPAERFASNTHATAEIVTSEIIPGAALSGSVTLDNDGDEHLAGTLALSWPHGGSLVYAVGVAGERREIEACLEAPEVIEASSTSSNDGVKTSLDACLDVSTTDGSIAVKLDGGTFEGGVTQATLALEPGACSGAAGDGSNPSSHASFTVIAKQAVITGAAAVVGSGRDPKPFSLMADAFAPAMIDLVCPPSAPDLSLVPLVVTANRGGADADVEVTLDATPAVDFVPATARTGDDGTVTVRFQKPPGSVYVRARLGSDVKDCTID